VDRERRGRGVGVCAAYLEERRKEWGIREGHGIRRGRGRECEPLDGWACPKGLEFFF
jgi:hypothetical protein